ncbi:MAG: hypothetical protein ABI923_00200 [bacterium]
MKFSRLHSFKFRALLWAIPMLLIFGSVASAQDPKVTQMTAPPPMRFIPRNEREQLATAKDAKERTRSTIQMADNHLLRAEELTANRNHDSALIEIGNYMALIEDAMGFLGGMKRDSNRTRDLYKRLELALRAQSLRLAAIRRVSPAEYAGQITIAGEFARDQRSEALKAFYGHTVVPDSPEEAKRRPGERPAKEPNPGGDTKRP